MYVYHISHKKILQKKINKILIIKIKFKGKKRKDKQKKGRLWAEDDDAGSYIY